MSSEPLHRQFGMPLSEWIERVPNELEVDAIGLWQIVPTLRSEFGLEGSDLDCATRQCVTLIVAKGAEPVYGSDNPDGWAIWLSLVESDLPLVEKVMRYLARLGRDPNHGDLWLSVP